MRRSGLSGRAGCCKTGPEMLKVGTEAPDFAAETTAGAQLALRELRGRWVVLYFFPKAFTAG